MTRRTLQRARHADSGRSCKPRSGGLGKRELTKAQGAATSRRPLPFRISEPLYIKHADRKLFENPSEVRLPQQLDVVQFMFLGRAVEELVGDAILHRLICFEAERQDLDTSEYGQYRA